MKAYWDNDVVKKLAAYDLTAEAVEALELTSVTILATLRFTFSLKSAAEAQSRLRIKPSVHGRIVAFVDGTGVEELKSPPSKDEQKALAGVPNIDPGEAILALAASKDPDSLLCTGDKRFLKALAKSPKTAALVQSLDGRVICLEQIVRLIVAKKGLDHVRPRILSEVGEDQAMKSIFGDPQAAAASIEEGFAAYIGEMRGLAPFLWAADEAAPPEPPGVEAP